MKRLKQKAFTLVELIIVVTILAILSTIGFMSYTSYLPSVRDSSRLEEIGIIRDNLEKYRLSNKLPIPDSLVEVKSNGTVIGYQGYAGETVLDSIGLQDGGEDPLDKVYYTYYITKNKKYFQLLTFLEENDLLTTLDLNLLKKTNAGGLDYTNRYIKVTGFKLGILTESGSNSPIQEINSIISAGNLDIGTTADDYIAHISDTQTIGGDGTVLKGSLPKASCKRIKEIGGDNGDGIYRINPTGASEITVYCDMTNDGGGWTLVMHGTDTDIDKYDSRGDSTWLSGTNTINYYSTSNSFKLNDTLINSVRGNDGIYRIDANSDVAGKTTFYTPSTCIYNHDLGENGDCAKLFTDKNMETNISCTGNSSHKGIGCRMGIVTNNNSSSHILCYGKDGSGQCTNNGENISIKLYVK